MACRISDIIVTAGDDGAGGAASVTVTGRAEECPSRRITVKLFCGGTPVGFQSAPVAAGGQWSATFDPVGCRCGGAVRVEAECEGTPSCSTVFQDELECTPPEGECPSLDGIHVEIGDCTDDFPRLRTVTFEITTNAAAAAAVELEFGDGDSDAYAAAVGVHTETLEHVYEPGVYQPTLSFILPEGCPPVLLDQIEVEECTVCLDVQDVQITISDCRADGTRDVTFAFPALVSGELDFGDGDAAGFAGVRQTHAYVPRGEPYTATLRLDGCAPVELLVALDPCPPGCLDPSQVEVSVDDCDPDRQRLATFIFSRPITGEIDFGDGSAPAHVDGDRVTYRYPADVSPETTYPAVLTVDGCEPIAVGVPVPACPCIDANQVEITAAEECDDEGNRAVTFTFPWEITGDLDYGDGEADHFTSSTRTHLYVPMDDPYPARLSLRGCPPVDLPVQVQSCDGGGGGGGGGEPSECGNLDVVVAGLLGLALAATLLLLTLQCLNIPVPWFLWLIPAVFAAAAGVVILFWFLFCDPPTACDWLAIAWMVSLAGAIVALYLSACCPLMAVMALVLAAAAVAGFAAWVAACHPTPCGILRRVTVAISTGAGGILGAIGAAVAFVPPLAACVLWWVAAVVGVLVGILVPAALVCDDG